MKFWEKDLQLTDNLIKDAEEWHKVNFPKCRGQIKNNNECNHYRWFFQGVRYAFLSILDKIE